MEINRPPQNVNTGHSRLAVSAFASALLSVSILVIVFLMYQTEIAEPPSDMQVFFNRIALGAGCLLNPASILLGLAALYQPGRKKLFGVLAIGLSILVAAALVVFMLMAVFAAS